MSFEMDSFSVPATVNAVVRRHETKLKGTAEMQNIAQIACLFVAIAAMQTYGEEPKPKLPPVFKSDDAKSAMKNYTDGVAALDEKFQNELRTAKDALRKALLQEALKATEVDDKEAARILAYVHSEEFGYVRRKSQPKVFVDPTAEIEVGSIPNAAKPVNGVMPNDPLALGTVWKGSLKGIDSKKRAINEVAKGTITNRTAKTFEIRLSFNGYEWLYNFDLKQGGKDYESKQAMLIKQPPNSVAQKGKNPVNANANVSSNGQIHNLTIETFLQAGDGGTQAVYDLKR